MVRRQPRRPDGLGDSQMPYPNDTTSGGGQSQHAGASVPMRVALISQTGAIYTMWLPDTMEGRYRFHSELRLPIYVWATHCPFSAST